MALLFCAKRLFVAPWISDISPSPQVPKKIPGPNGAGYSGKISDYLAATPPPRDVLPPRWDRVDLAGFQETAFDLGERASVTLDYALNGSPTRGDMVNGGPFLMYGCCVVKEYATPSGAVKFLSDGLST